MPRLLPRIALLGAIAVALAGCGATPGPTPRPDPTPSDSAVAGQSLRPVGEPRDLATGLVSPWSILRLGVDAADGSEVVLISERDTGAIERVLADGSLVRLGVVPGVNAGGEGGLLGLAALDDDQGTWLYAYFTSETDNRIVRMRLGAGLELGDPQIVIAGITWAAHHDGGRIAFGPDGMLYATVGDAGRPDLAQDPTSLNGKILRMTPTGAVPDDNPTAGSLVYSLGHRNPQGIAWDADGQLWAAEFGQNTWDEFNRIEPGANYGWPVVEGGAGDSRFVDPVLQWATNEASPSGLAFVDGTFFLACLRGERLWAIDVADDGTATATPWLVGEYGRLRDVTAGPDGTLWFLTNNTDGRGDPRGGDDRLLEVHLAPGADG
jgi:glucose/arabinose dehydrogenase